MKKKLLYRGMAGFPQGIAIGFAITIFISACIGDGNYYPVSTVFAENMGSELAAVVLQTILCGIMGSAYAMASVIWEMDSWSLVKQSGIYFAIACVATLPVAYVANWMEHSLTGILFYVGIFVGIFIFVWIVQYLAWRSKIKRMNRKVKEANDFRD